MYPIILASGSPRRKEILSQVGYVFSIEPSQKEEIATSDVPSDFVMQLSRVKAEDIASQKDGPVIIIGADTVVAVDQTILGKPKDEEHAAKMLRMIAGRDHEVYTGVTVIGKEIDGTSRYETFYEKAKVTIASMSEREIQAYIESKEPMDKAGAYAIQGKFACYVNRIEGDYYTIVGLPIAHLYKVIKELTME